MALPTLLQASVFSSVGTNHTDWSAAFGAATTAGSTILAYGMAFVQPTAALTFSDNHNAGNYAADLANAGVGSHGMLLGRMSNTYTGTGLSVNLHSTIGANLTFILQEWGNIGGLDQIAPIVADVSPSQHASSGATPGLSASGELAVGFCTSGGTTNWRLETGSTWTLDTAVHQANYLGVNYLAGTPDASAQTALFNLFNAGNQAWACGCATYFSAGGATVDPGQLATKRRGFLSPRTPFGRMFRQSASGLLVPERRVLVPTWS